MDDIFKNKEGIGYFIECDLEYPKELHYLHNDYPLATEKLIVQDDWLSPFCKNLKEKFGLASDKTTKLIPILFNKEKYVLHVRNLSLYKDLGMKLTKIHRMLQFNESPWLANFKIKNYLITVIIQKIVRSFFIKIKRQLG